MSILDYSDFYLVGIKGVAVASLAQCLLDAGKQVRGSDVAEDFVTQEVLAATGVSVDEGFETPVPDDIECVVYTAAHGGPDNPQVQAAQARQIPTMSHAEALASLFNQKKGVAVCGVGGKSTVSAMITWILWQLSSNSDPDSKTSAKLKPSFSVGVGNIPGINKTGVWNQQSEYFVAEADEYVTDPSALEKDQQLTPRFSFMKPHLTVCTNLEFDHPDVYQDFNHTKEVFGQFFNQIRDGGFLVVNANDAELLELAKATIKLSDEQVKLVTFGDSSETEVSANFSLESYSSREGTTKGEVKYGGHTLTLELQLPGKFNLLNAVAALAACQNLGISPLQSAKALKHFRSTLRRSEFVAEKNGVKYYDDYAHHPNEVAGIIKAFQEWYPESRLVVAFQSHTYSRTKQLFDEFVDAFKDAKEVVMIDIFPSAREKMDTSVSSDKLCTTIEQKFSSVKAKNLKTIKDLAAYFQAELKPGDVALTVGAGDIYLVHDLI